MTISASQELWAKLGGFGIGIMIGLLGAPFVLFGLISLVRGQRANVTSDSETQS